MLINLISNKSKLLMSRKYLKIFVSVSENYHSAKPIVETETEIVTNSRRLDETLFNNNKLL